MSESKAHLDGVRALQLDILSALAGRNDVILYRDTPDEDPQRKPPLIGGFRPDVFVRTWKNGAIYVGEAKTARDLRSAHTASQLSAFLDALHGPLESQLTISVPFKCLAEAHDLLRYIADRKSHPIRTRCIATEIILERHLAEAF